jgi:uncharacterized protein YjbI with pentapeptide repeats
MDKIDKIERMNILEKRLSVLVKTGEKSDFAKGFRRAILQSHFAEGKISKKNLQEKNLREKNLREKNFREKNLREKNFQEKNLQEKNLREKNLREKNFQEKHLSLFYFTILLSKLQASF